MNRSRRGFTLIEVLVVIGVILVLVGIVSVGITYVSRSGKENATRVTLNNLRGLVTELEATAGLGGRQPTVIWRNGSSVAATTANPIDIWKDADPSTVAPTYEAALVPNAPVVPDSVARYESDVVLNTQLVMQILLTVPKNRQMVGQLPAEEKMEKVPGTGSTNLMLNSASDRTPNPTIPLDPWGNPIIFVPGAGLCGIDSRGNAAAMVIGGKPDDLEAKLVVQTPGTATDKVAPIRSPDGRSFWASAGPDGDFRTGDDNLYSFGN